MRYVNSYHNHFDKDVSQVNIMTSGNELVRIIEIKYHSTDIHLDIH
jgi:hypothetical protein